MNRLDDPHVDIGAFVLHALPADEEAAFENHLASCDSCRREADQLSWTVGELAGAESRAPSADVRRRVLEQIGTVRQDGPAEAVSRRHRRRQRILVLALAVSVAAALALGGVAWWQHSEADTARGQVADARAGTTELAEILAAPDVTITTGDLARGGTASVIASRSRDQAVFVVSGLPPLTGDQVYELWYAEGERIWSAGEMSAAGGSQTCVMEGALAGATSVGITVEPTGGSPRPTSDPLGVIRVPA
ncbi:anti-sigma factor domain-containing protein [Streptomyces sp. NPDC047706]|uniref:anti-sigma factor n=1 Tax=Streptomyces sp. NPDC047706 TaxID=3365486 RepID=UPI0037126C91